MTNPDRIPLVTAPALHTPGPWAITDWEFAIEVCAGEQGGPCIARGIGRMPDARLIAAAPEMLAALELAADTIKDMDGGDPAHETGWASDELLEAWLAVRAAIAKARGASQ